MNIPGLPAEFALPAVDRAFTLTVLLAALLGGLAVDVLLTLRPFSRHRPSHMGSLLMSAPWAAFAPGPPPRYGRLRLPHLRAYRVPTLGERASLPASGERSSYDHAGDFARSSRPSTARACAARPGTAGRARNRHLRIRRRARHWRRYRVCRADCAHACGSGDRERARPCGRRSRSQCPCCVRWSAPPLLRGQAIGDSSHPSCKD